MAITVRRLDVLDAEMASSFDCGEQQLNEFIKKYAVKHQGPHMFGVTYVALSSEVPDRILGYYTLANSSICRAKMPEEVLKGLLKYADLPAILIGRFAVDTTFAGRGVGHILMSYALNMCLEVSKLSGARYVLNLAYKEAVSWYKRYGFQEISSAVDPGHQKMFLDLTVVRKAQEAGMALLFSVKTS